MNIIKNKYVINNISNINITSVTKEDDINKISPFLLHKILNSPISIPVVRLYLLNDDESIRMDASGDLVGGTLSITYQTGQRRSLNVELVNINKKWTPKPVTGLIWLGSKFRLDTGIVWHDTVYWKRQGVFMVKDPQYTRESSKQTISFQMCDKFGLLDGTVFGRSSLKTVVPQGINMKTCFYTMLTTDRGNGLPYDNKKIIFSERYKNIETFYDIEQGYNECIGDIITELGTSISCDVFYNEYGNLVVKSGINDYASESLPVVYRFTEGDRNIISASLRENWSKMRNIITVKGAVVNGYQFTATLKNNRLSSPFNIDVCGESPKIITDDKIYSDELCMDRAMYEMIQHSRGVKSLSISCAFMPHLDVNQMVLVDYPSFDINTGKFIIDDINMDLSSFNENISLTNAREVCF